MNANTIYNEPCLETLSRMPENFLDCVITSPPYWHLRDYGYTGQWGMEPTYTEYLENLWSMMDEIYRVLKPEGTAWVNLGDTYGTQSGNIRNPGKSKNTDYNGNGIHFIQPKSLHKSLLLLPHRFAIGCMDRGWIVRNDCIWAKRNCMPESVTDRFSKKHEYFFFMVKSEKYFFDLDAIREKYKTISIERAMRGVSENHKWKNGCDGHSPDSLNKTRPNRTKHNFGGTKLDGIDLHTTYSGNEWNPREDGKNPGAVADFWDIPTKNSKSNHYATYNDELLKKPILAGCPEGGIIYDPFMGTGSTAECALRANRQFIGSEMSSEYCEIANKRLEQFLDQPKLL